MFTGIIEEVGEVKEFLRKGKSASITVAASTVIADVKIGDSIAVNGVCLTVKSFNDRCFTADLSEETLTVTKFSSIKTNDKVNLERALRLSDRLSGHIVTGHIDCVGTVMQRVDKGDFSVFIINFDSVFSRYVIKKGSIAIDGVSLTINDITQEGVRLNIIPHTLEQTNLKFMSKASKVNIEFDVISKYLESLLKGNKENKITLDFLTKTGFIGGNNL